jgi:segregation and condensation protein A
MGARKSLMNTDDELIGQENYHAQVEMPFAVVQGNPITEPPRDLYIPPDALEVFLEAFEGPLDLLLYLIKRQNLDILDIPIARITEQYMSYIDMMQELKLELAAEYLVMAALLAEIKSRMLLPRPRAEEEDEADPRAELVRRLQEYERFKKAADDLSEMPRMEREWHEVVVEFDRSTSSPPPLPDVTLDALLEAFRDVLKRADMFADHSIQREPLSVRERMSKVLEMARVDRFTAFHQFFSGVEGRAGAVVTLVAILELLKEALIEIVQNAERDPIYVKLAA